MNLTNFLKRTDELAAKYTTAQLISFIHNIGRVLPEKDREDFLMKLKAAGEENENALKTDFVKGYNFSKTYEYIRNNLKIIDSQEITIERIPNEAYDDWYDDNSEEFIYEDSEGITEMLAEACDFVHICMDREKYTEGYEIGKQLCEMQILCESEYGDEEFSIADMVYHKILSCDLRQTALDALYCAYQSVPMEKRPEIFYEMISDLRRDKITLEEVMQHGDSELPDFRQFLTCLIPFVGDKTGYYADRLFAEAVSLLDEAPAAAEYAKKYAAVHPGLYLELLENRKSADEKAMASIGFEAMKTIPEKYIMRSRVALKTAEYLIRANEDSSLLEMCYFTAYESDTSALNYLRVLLNGYGTETKRKELKKIFMAFSADENDRFYGYSDFNSERKENKPDLNMLLLLWFLDGQFADVLAEGMDKQEALGWTGTFMKQGIALYLLYLYEGRWSGSGMAEMANIAKTAIGFSEEKYLRGLPEISEKTETDLFMDIFLKWKSIVRMEPGVREYAIGKITKLLEKRTEGIMNANRRRYYGECAAYIAALGEVQESLGDTGAKQRLMTSYKDKYSRRSAFRAEMKEYGWRGV